ncbi:glycosyltransferase family 2 protein [soil metagenome]
MAILNMALLNMALLDLLFLVAALYLGLQFAVLVSNLAFFPVLRPGRVARLPRVSVLVPARDEAHNLPETLPRLLAQGALEVLVLDDGSSDRTPSVLEEHAARHPTLRVLKGAPLPRGWSGKNWACQQLAEAARGDLLVFTDADVRWGAGTLPALLAFRQRARADYLSVWPRQLTHSLMERLTVPLIDMVLLGGLPYLGVRYAPVASLSAGNGQLMLWTRAAYWGVGGHRAVRASVLEDVKMGQLAKATGCRVALAVGGRMIGTRMYRGHDEVVAGFSKSLLAVHLGSPWALGLSLLLNTLAYSLPYLFALWSPQWLLLAALGLVQRALTCLKTRRNPLEAFLQPLMAYPLWLIGVRALWRRGGYEWKGRSYELP